MSRRGHDEQKKGMGRKVDNVMVSLDAVLAVIEEIRRKWAAIHANEAEDALDDLRNALIDRLSR